MKTRKNWNIFFGIFFIVLAGTLLIIGWDGVRYTGIILYFFLILVAVVMITTAREQHILIMLAEKKLKEKNINLPIQKEVKKYSEDFTLEIETKGTKITNVSIKKE
jgi:hypothetical protein